MGILDRIFPARRDAQVLALAEELVDLQAARVWRKLSPRAGSLGSVPEARGYIRCRAVDVVRCGLTHLGESVEEMPHEMHERVVERALELLVGQYVGHMVTPMPAVAVERRAA